jgi:DNA-binding XRE family transcriptional regulator
VKSINLLYIYAVDIYVSSTYAENMTHGKNLAKNFGTNLRKIRDARNLSQEQLAELCGVHRTFIGRIERGETNITLLTLFKVAKALEVSPELLIRGIDEGN